MKRYTCRGCGSTDINLIHDFGDQPLAGTFPLNPESVKSTRRYALDLSQCRSCGLLQVSNVPPINEIFHGDYRYASSTIPGLVKHFEEYSQWISARLPARSNVLEFGCNDGILLRQLKDRGYNCKGVDASANIAMLAREKGLDVDIDFFSDELIIKNNYECRFDLITCSNVYAHIDNLSSVTLAVHKALKEGGLFAIEVHDGHFISTEGQFDTIYHEHLTYFDENSIAQHLHAHGFKVIEIEHTAMHGGGLRVLSRRINFNSQKKSDSQSLPTLMSNVAIQNDIDIAYSNVSELKRLHRKLWGYGAAGRSQMFINFTKTSEHFESIYDDSPLRQNRYIISTDLKIKPFEAKFHDGACVILAWNYAGDIARKISPYFREVYTILPKVKQWT